jgi:hypothetical protein
VIADISHLPKVLSLRQDLLKLLSAYPEEKIWSGMVVIIIVVVSI